MPDPASLALSGATTAFKVCKETYNMIEGIKKAPLDVQRVATDLKGFYGVLGGMERLFGNRQQSLPSDGPGCNIVGNVVSLLDDCVGVFKELQQQISPFVAVNGRAIHGAWEGLKWDKFSKDEVQYLRGHLSTLKSSLNLALTATTMVSVSRIEESTSRTEQMIACLQEQVKAVQLQLARAGQIDQPLMQDTLPRGEALVNNTAGVRDSTSSAFSVASITTVNSMNQSARQLVRSAVSSLLSLYLLDSTERLIPADDPDVEVMNTSDHITSYDLTTHWPVFPNDSLHSNDSNHSVLVKPGDEKIMKLQRIVEEGNDGNLEVPSFPSGTVGLSKSGGSRVQGRVQAYVLHDWDPYGRDNIFPPTRLDRLQTTSSGFLTIRQGDQVQVLSHHDNGWWFGAVSGRRGWFPSNYCAELSADAWTPYGQLIHKITPTQANEMAVAELMSHVPLLEKSLGQHALLCFGTFVLRKPDSGINDTCRCYLFDTALIFVKEVAQKPPTRSRRWSSSLRLRQKSALPQLDVFDRIAVQDIISVRQLDQDSRDYLSDSWGLEITWKANEIERLHLRMPSQEIQTQWHQHLCALWT